MKAEAASVIAARVAADLARQRLVGTFDELQQQFAPHTIMREAWETARDKGADLAESAVDAVRKRPVAATGVVAAIALFIAREPLMGLAGKLTGKSKKTPGKSRPKTRSTEKVE